MEHLDYRTCHIKMISMNHQMSHKGDTIDMVTVGERGQVVIPMAIRDTLGLQAGDKLMAFLKHGEMVCLVPASSMQRLVQTLQMQIDEIEHNKTNTTEG